MQGRGALKLSVFANDLLGLLLELVLELFDRLHGGSIALNRYGGFVVLFCFGCSSLGCLCLCTRRVLDFGGNELLDRLGELSVYPNRSFPDVGSWLECKTVLDQSVELFFGEFEHLGLTLVQDRANTRDVVFLDQAGVESAVFFVDLHHAVSGEVDDLLKVFRSHVEQVAQTARNTLEVPDVGYWRGKFDVAHALTTNRRLGNFNTTALTNDALVSNTLVLATGTLPVLGRTEDLLAEQAIFFWLERAVVDGLWLLYFTV